MIRPVERCLICGNAALTPILSLGEQALTGVFPRDPDAPITRGPLDLIKCDEQNPRGVENPCGLVQLSRIYDLAEMYGENYGYRSGLNAGMVAHLGEIARAHASAARLQSGDIILDIGANDGTLLGHHDPALRRMGMDPTADKFRQFHPAGTEIIADFFSADAFLADSGGIRARAISSISMFYDLESPLGFMREVRRALADDGVWMLEQSHMPLMIERLAYDTVCHEHLEYYGLRQIAWMAERAGFEIHSAEFNDTNGGSSLLMLGAPGAAAPNARERIAELLATERAEGYATPAPYAAFAAKVAEHREQIRSYFRQVREEGRRVLGYGASTKGNVILQYCGIGPDDLPAIAEVNEDKFGSHTPGTNIPIISEADARAMRPDEFFVLPWHFREGILSREREFLAGGGRIVLPLPKLEIVSG